MSSASLCRWYWPSWCRASGRRRIVPCLRRAADMRHVLVQIARYQNHLVRALDVMPGHAVGAAIVGVGGLICVATALREDAIGDCEVGVVVAGDPHDPALLGPLAEIGEAVTERNRLVIGDEVDGLDVGEPFGVATLAAPVTAVLGVRCLCAARQALAFRHIGAIVLRQTFE